MQNFSGGTVRASPCSSYLHAPLYEERFARLIHRPGRVLGGPSARAACGGCLSLPWLPRRGVRHKRGRMCPAHPHASCVEPAPARQSGAARQISRPSS
jgi:hypothetical protein